MRFQPRDHKWLRTLGSVYLAIGLLVALAVATATATIIEAYSGTPAAQALVYRARWFEGLLGLTILNLLAMFLIRWPYRKAQTGFVLTHLAIIWILISAGITRYFGYEGVMTIREGAAADFLYSREAYLQLQIGEERVSAPVNLWKPGPQKLERTLTLGGEAYQVAILDYWPHAQEQQVEAETGSPAVDLTLVAGSHRHRETLSAGDSIEEDGLLVALHEGALPATSPMPPYGLLEIKLGGATHTLAVSFEPPGELRVGDTRIRITEFQPNFKVGSTRQPGDPMENPAVRVRVEPAAGDPEERLLFAFHPEFDMAHAGGTSALPDLTMSYKYQRRVDLLVASPGKLTAIANFALQLGDDTKPAGSSEPGRPPDASPSAGSGKMAGAIEPGQQFTCSAATPLLAPGLSVLFHQAWMAAATRLVPSEDENDPEFARARVSLPDGSTVESMVRVRWSDTALRLGSVTAQIAIAPIRIDLPYRVHLDDFVMLTYPGSDNPASFESHVRLTDDARGIKDQPHRIYMNHPLTYRGFKHFQSSYDRDRAGTVLSVNHDPGKWPTYLGYFLISLGFMITLTRGKLWMREPRLPKELSK